MRSKGPSSKNHSRTTAPSTGSGAKNFRDNRPKKKQKKTSPQGSTKGGRPTTNHNNEQKKTSRNAEQTHRRRRNYHRGNNRPHAEGRAKYPCSPGEALRNKYLSLLEKQNKARSLYFEQFGRSDKKKTNSLEKSYSAATKELRIFEEKLTDRDKKLLQDALVIYPLENGYTLENPETVQIQVENVSEDFQDPHITQAQKTRPSFKEDKEETVASKEDIEMWLKKREEKN